MKLLRSNKLCLLFELFKRFKSEKGFTLVELLVVIGVLGILATGLLATIDPLEQFRKGNDSNSRQTSLELVNALTRYYAVHSAFPWDSTANGGAGCNGGTAPAPTRVSNIGGATAFNDCLTTLVNEGELKSAFPTQYPILSKLWAIDTTPAGSTARSATVCYNPDSKSESTKAETKYAGTVSGGPTVPLSSTCTPSTNADCYWCAQ